MLITGLPNLPEELLLAVISHLHDFEAEVLARTLNRRLYALCLPCLTHRLRVHRNTRRVICIFGDPSEHRYLYRTVDYFEKCYTIFKLEWKYDPFVSTEYYDYNLDYMDFNGDMRLWTQHKNFEPPELPSSYSDCSD